VQLIHRPVTGFGASRLTAFNAGRLIVASFESGDRRGSVPILWPLVRLL